MRRASAWRGTSSGGGWAVFLVLALWGAAIFGWIANVVKIALTAGDPLSGLFIFRVVGAFILPIGAVLGWV